jgi:hypothetical protein
MKVIIYTSNSTRSKGLIAELMESFADTARIESYAKLDELKRRLETLYDISILILYLDDTDILSQLLQFKNLIAQVKTILILPDSKDKTVAAAHQLRPNYIGYEEENGLIQNIRAVVDRLIMIHAQ